MEVEAKFTEEDGAQFALMYRKWRSPAVKAVKPLLMVGFPDSQRHAVFYPSGSLRDRSIALQLRQIQREEDGCALERFDSLTSRFMHPVLDLKTFKVTMPKFTNRVFQLAQAKTRVLLTTRDPSGNTVYPYAMILRRKAGVETPTKPSDLEYVRYFARSGKKEELSWTEAVTITK